MTVATSHMLLREMRPSDIPRVRRIEVAAYADAWPATTFEAELRNGLALYLVAADVTPAELRPRLSMWRRLLAPAHEAERVVGYCGAWFTQDQMHIVTVAVDPSRQGEGIAQRLLLECFERARRAEMRNLTLEVRVSNHRAQQIYERFGFQPVGRLPGYYKNNGEDAIVMLTGDLTSEAMVAALERATQEQAQRFAPVQWTVDTSA